MTQRPSERPFPPRKKHWINLCNSSGCELQLFDRQYTIWLSNKDWKQAERDGDTLINALESLENHQEALRQAKAEAFEEAATMAEQRDTPSVLASRLRNEAAAELRENGGKK